MGRVISTKLDVESELASRSRVADGGGESFFLLPNQPLMTPKPLFLRSALEVGSNEGRDKGEGALRSHSSGPRFDVRGVTIAVEADEVDETDSAPVRRDDPDFSDADESDEWEDIVRDELWQNKS